MIEQPENTFDFFLSTLKQPGWAAAPVKKLDVAKPTPAGDDSELIKALTDANNAIQKAINHYRRTSASHVDDHTTKRNRLPHAPEHLACLAEDFVKPTKQQCFISGTHLKRFMEQVIALTEIHNDTQAN